MLRSQSDNLLYSLEVWLKHTVEYTSMAASKSSVLSKPAFPWHVKVSIWCDVPQALSLIQVWCVLAVRLLEKVKVCVLAAGAEVGGEGNALWSLLLCRRESFACASGSGEGQCVAHPAPG